MKKILISILIVLLLILSYFWIWHGIKVIKIKSVNDIKRAGLKLEQHLDSANELDSQTYPNKEEELKKAIDSLKDSKQAYENKSKYNTSGTSIGNVEIKTYKIHYLWAVLGSYRKEESVKSLNLDLKTTETQDVYDLQITLVGSYVAITDFIYDVENDEELNFEVKNLSIQPYTTTTTTTTTITSGGSTTKKTSPFKKITEITSSTLGTSNNTNSSGNTNDTNNNTQSDTNKSNTSTSNTSNKTIIYDPEWVEVTFKVEDVGITLD